MNAPHRRLSLPEDRSERSQALIAREWLITNGLGGYSSNTIAGVPTRRYHGILISALPNPLGRLVMLTEVSERVRLGDGTVARLAGEERKGGALALPVLDHLSAFYLEFGLPVWEYRIGAALLEKRVLMPYQQNTVHVTYRLQSAAAPVRLNLRPALNIRPIEHPVSTPLHTHHVVRSIDDRIEIDSGYDLPSLRLLLRARAGAFTIEPRELTERLYRVEAQRGYEDSGAVWSAGFFRADLHPGDEVTLIASTEPWTTIEALGPEHALAAEQQRRNRLLQQAPAPLQKSPIADLVLAADAFLITPAYRAEDVAQRRAAGDELRSVIAGYHWFTDWGRDTMISLEGLALATGRRREAGEILRTFAQYTRAGLIPNMFPNGSSEGHYNTADATLWFFHAVQRYFEASNDQTTLQQLLPILRAIADHHLRGTEFGIRIADDGLLLQGAEGVQLTWMDAKVDGWVVTPRRGKAVELSALWYNALRLLAGWLRSFGEEEAANLYSGHADQTFATFNQRFWFEQGGYLYDVVDGPDGNDPALRPNQLFALSLEHPVLTRERWQSVFDVVTAQLLTPVGLRSLAPTDPEYKRSYHGDLRTRDAAYHQGTVWGWLIGPYVDAYLRLHPEDRGAARGLLTGLLEHLDDFGVGSIAEIFDAAPPYTPRGCIAQAWSVAEVLRCWLRTA